jgi:hypothetical protein
VKDFGVNDVTVAYKRDNNFYYIPNSYFEVPEALNPERRESSVKRR